MSQVIRGSTALILGFAAILSCQNNSKAADASPHAELSNDVLSCVLNLPDAQNGAYRGPRFDWSGNIVQVTREKTLTFLTTLHSNGPPDSHDGTAAGIIEEFGMQQPLGFAEAAPGETFVKIGVGELQRLDDHPYGFWQPYKIVRAGKWNITQNVLPSSSDSANGKSVTFHQRFEGPRGWSYDYRKVVELNADTVSITHILLNTGRKTIQTDHYAHNIFRFKNHSIDTEYAIVLPPRLTAKVLPEKLELRDNTVHFRKRLSENSVVYAEFVADQDPLQSWRLNVTTPEATIYCSGDWMLSSLHLYTQSNALCPEPFIQIELKPSEHLTWKTDYRFGSTGLPKSQ